MTPAEMLRLALVLDDRGRIISTREPEPKPGPLFTLGRSTSSCVWAVRADVPEDVAFEVERLAAEELPIQDPQAPPVHADKYLALIGGHVDSGPQFTFPDEIALRGEVTPVTDLRMLERNFRGWTAAEIPACSPILAIMEDGYPVSVCFSARSWETVAAAGVETAAAFRGRRFAPRVTAAWALAIRVSGRTPLYGTSWTNTASRAVARKLGLIYHASGWSLSGNVENIPRKS